MRGRGPPASGRAPTPPHAGPHMVAGEAEPGVSGGEAAPAGPPGAGAGAAGKPKPEADLVSRLQSEVRAAKEEKGKARGG